MVKKHIISKVYSRQEKSVERYMKEVRDIQAANLSRRELLKMGLTSGVGGLIAIGGNAFLPNLAFADSGSSNTGSNTVISPPCNMPWKDPLPIPKACQSVASMSGPAPDVEQCKSDDYRWNPGKNDYDSFKEARLEPHQRFAELGGVEACTYYELMAREIDWNFYSDSEYPGFNSKVWTYVDMNPNEQGEFATGILRINANYGKPVMMRMYNGLPSDAKNNQGFGINQISPHLHNAHNPPESDGGPTRFFDCGKWWDMWYPNIRAGFASTHKNGTSRNGHWCPGDWQETQSTLWFHDHRFDFTASNVYKGLASFYTLFSDDIDLDTGDETTGLRLPSGEFDIPLLFTDKILDASGQMFWDPFNLDGFLGDMQTVNFKIKPYLEVKRRKYRFRLLDAGPSRFLELFLSNGSKFIRIANDGNLLPKAQVVSSIRLGCAERADVILDFSQYAPGTVIFLENRLEQTNGRGPTGRILPSSSNTQLLKFIVTGDPVTDDSAPLATLQTQTMVPIPSRTNPVKKQRKWDFGTSNGAWTVNGKFFDPSTISAYPVEGSAELWTIKSGGNWAHPVHIHHEEHQLVSRNGKTTLPLEDQSRKDVIRIGTAAVGTTATGEAQFYMQFRDWYGDYPMHCHNVVHEDHAMMVLFRIVPPDDSKAGQ